MLSLRRLPGFLIPSILVALAAGAQRPAAAQDPGALAQSEAVLSRLFVVGTSPRVQKLMKENPQGHQFQRGLTEVRIDERPAPGRCGLSVGRYFRSQLVSKFSVSAANECTIADEAVNCRSSYLPGYSQLYLTLSYRHTPAELDLKFDVRQLGFWGQVRRPQLSADHVEWFEEAFDCLVSIAECSSEPPVCAKRL